MRFEKEFSSFRMWDFAIWERVLETQEGFVHLCVRNAPVMVQQCSFLFYFNTRQHALQFFFCHKKHSGTSSRTRKERIGWPKRISIQMRQRDWEWRARRMTSNTYAHPPAHVLFDPALAVLLACSERGGQQTKDTCLAALQPGPTLVNLMVGGGWRNPAIHATNISICAEIRAYTAAVTTRHNGLADVTYSDGIVLILKGDSVCLAVAVQ